MYLDDYIKIWQRIALEHKDIKGFFRQNDNELSDALRNQVEYPILVLGDYDGKIQESTQRVKHLDYMTPGIYLLDIIPRGDYDAEQQKLNRLKAIGMQIFGRLKHDKDNLCPRYFIDWQKDPIKYTLTNLFGDNVRGWLFEFAVYHTVSELKYNPNDWNFSNPESNS